MKHTIAAVVLSFFATVKVVADVFGFENLGAVAAVTNFAPAMKVFTAHKGYETFSAKFKLTLKANNGEEQSMRVSPSNYASLRGPYNRRNVYGALIAYGPILASDERTSQMWQQMSRRAFCNPAGVLREFGFSASQKINELRIDYLQQRDDGTVYPAQLSISCA